MKINIVFFMRLFVLIMLGIFFSNCAGIPKNIEAVRDFEVERYLGTWYEIARLDHRFERNLINVKATYSLRDDKGIRVFNEGFDTKSNKQKQIEGRAYFVGDPGLGRLKVSFFRPFYGGYNIIELDRENYFYALVCGNSRKYLWILAREPNLPDDIIQKLVNKAKDLGFDTDSLIFVEHEDKD